MEYKDIDFKEPSIVFEQAIKEGRLSRDKLASNYAGNYMYMGTYNNQDNFKNIITREYNI